MSLTYSNSLCLARIRMNSPNRNITLIRPWLNSQYLVQKYAIWGHSSCLEIKLACTLQHIGFKKSGHSCCEATVLRILRHLMESEFSSDNLNAAGCRMCLVWFGWWVSDFSSFLGPSTWWIAGGLVCLPGWRKLNVLTGIKQKDSPVRDHAPIDSLS